MQIKCLFYAVLAIQAMSVLSVPIDQPQSNSRRGLLSKVSLLEILREF
jgi:hypothetical protein